MKLNLIKSAATIGKQNDTKKGIVESVANILGAEKANAIFESFDVTEDDYGKWLEVIRGYAEEEGINIRSKGAFQEVAFAVLENDPLLLDPDMQEQVVASLWQKQKFELQHSKVQRGLKSREEEEQLHYALQKMSGGNTSDSCNTSRPVAREEEQYSGDAQDAGMDEVQQLLDKARQANHNNDYETAERLRNRAWTLRLRLPHSPNMRKPFDDLDVEEEEYEDDDWGIDLDQFGEDDNEPTFGDDENDWDDFEDPRDQEMQRRAPVQEQEEQDPPSPFHKGQLVTNKKDGASYKVEIADGPGDMVGLLVNGRIKMVPAKDLEGSGLENEEDSTSNPQPKKLSFLHDVLTGEQSHEHMKVLQQKIETDGANAWTTHHAKMPKNPHPKGSYAHKAWEKGVKTAAKEVWAPKPVVDPGKVKPKPKPKKK